MIRIAPSLLSSNFAHLAREVSRLDGADLIHIDVMDGHFVPNLTIGPPVIRDLRKETRLPFDVHLMVENPEGLLADFLSLGVDILTAHVESTPHIHRVLQVIKASGIRAGVALNPATPVTALEHVLDLADLILIMTVNPGFGGQEFIPAMLPKIQKVREMTSAAGRRIEIEVDGGISPETAPLVVERGATVLVTGSYIFSNKDPREALHRLRSAASRW